ncbi:hypothetical protein INR49_021026 [Caranx melampygus]|nr:hypothetical protein INR49_021026 [Caranx melampygus]
MNYKSVTDDTPPPPPSLPPFPFPTLHSLSHPNPPIISRLQQAAPGPGELRIEPLTSSLSDSRLQTSTVVQQQQQQQQQQHTEIDIRTLSKQCQLQSKVFFKAMQGPCGAAGRTEERPTL